MCSFVPLLSVTLMPVLIQHAGKCPVNDPPPPELLSQWKGPMMVMSMPKPCGCTGPNATKVTGSDTSTDPNMLLLQTLNSAFTMFSKTMPAVHAAAPVAADPHHASLPPPVIEDELEKCLEVFHKAKGLSSEVIG
jgi:hypothetical protein